MGNGRGVKQQCLGNVLLGTDMSMCIQMYGRNADFVCSLIFEVCKYGMWFWYYIVDLYDFVCMVAAYML